jgi:hypothetical protein
MNTETLFFVNLNNDALQLLDNIPTLTSVPFPIVDATDCVENTLNFLGVITSNKASMLQGCRKYETKLSEILDLLKERYSNYSFFETSKPFSFLIDNLPPNTATFGGLLNPPGRGHAVIFVKDNVGNLYLVDRQQNVKFLNDNIDKYLKFMNYDNKLVMVYFASNSENYKLLGDKRKRENFPSLRKENEDKSESKVQKIYGGKKNKSRKHKSRKHKSRKHKSRKHKKRTYDM